MRLTPYTKFKSAFAAICEAHRGIFSPRDSIGDGAAYILPTPLGNLRASIHADGFKNRRGERAVESIFLRFETYDTGKVHDTLLGRDFNGYSGKWNICVSSGSLQSARHDCLLEFKSRLERLNEAAARL